MRNRTIFPDKSRKLLEPVRKSCPFFHPSISTITHSTMTEHEFNYDYYQFTRDLPIAQEVKDNLKYLFQLYSRVCEAGGLVCVIANNLLAKIISQMSTKYPEIKNMAPENIVEHYIKFDLFSYEIVLKTGKRISNDKLMSLQLPKFVYEAELCECLGNLQKGLQLYNQDVVVLSSLCNVLKLDPSIFNLTKIFETYQEETVKVFVQDADQKDYIPGAIGLKTGNSEGIKNLCDNSDKCSKNLSIETQCKLFSQGNSYKLKGSLTQLDMTLKQFNTYFNLCQSFEEKNQFLKNKLIRNENQKNLFAFELDPKDEYLIGEIYRKVKDTFLCYKQKYDLLSYADEDMPGVTLPKFQIQAQGNWQGGTQQPFGISKININFGPDSNQWYCISGDNLNKFYAVIKTQYGISAEKIEGQWFEDIDWFIERNIPIKKVIQKKGDGIIIGNESIFWQKSNGKSLHASWNFMGKSDKQIIAAINKCIKIKQIQSPIIPTPPPILNRWVKKIPLKAIFLRVLNHEQTKQKNEGDISAGCLVMIRQWLKKWSTEEEKFLNQLIVRQDITNCKYKFYYLLDAENYCSYCENQILNYFLNNNGLSCLECGAKSFTAKRSTELKDKNIYYRYEPFWVTQLIYYGSVRTLHRTSSSHEFEQLCNGLFVGKIQNCPQAQRKSMENEPPQIIQAEYDWQNFLRQFNQEQSNNIENLFQKKVRSLIYKAKNYDPAENLMQSLPKNFNTQTNLSLVCETTDKDIEVFVSTFKKSQTQTVPEATIPSLTYIDQKKADISESSLKRKEKRILLRRQSDSETECSNQLLDGKFGGSRPKESMKQRNNYRRSEDIIKENSNESTKYYTKRTYHDRDEAQIRRNYREPSRSSSTQRSTERQIRKQKRSYQATEKYGERYVNYKEKQRFNSKDSSNFKIYCENYSSGKRDHRQKY